MADITISDLELAPALTDDMVLPVENTTDTYAATLAMLRRLLNKTFVEVANADFNDLTDDGFYQCTGTPTNSPEAGAINWTLQVSAESGVVVQRAFSLDDNFANLYIRRWNGVTWTGWLDVGKGALDNKADIDRGVPIGAVLPYGGSTAPTGWLICNGGVISRTTYADLFAVIGTLYGAGDGSTTFNLPNFQDRVIQGSGTRGSVGTYKAESLPNITGTIRSNISSQTYKLELVGTGCAQTNTATRFNITSIGGTSFNTANDGVIINASSSSSTYKNGAPVQPNALLIQCCIKY